MVFKLCPASLWGIPRQPEMGVNASHTVIFFPWCISGTEQLPVRVTALAVAPLAQVLEILYKPVASESQSCITEDSPAPPRPLIIRFLLASAVQVALLCAPGLNLPASQKETVRSISCPPTQYPETSSSDKVSARQKSDETAEYLQAKELSVQPGTAGNESACQLPAGGRKRAGNGEREETKSVGRGEGGERGRKRERD